jgi:hypothetical protein
MARIIRVKINWTGFPGGPGYTNLHFEPVAGGDISQAVADDAVAVTQTWIAAFRPDMPSSVTTGVDPTVTEIDENYGTIEAFWTSTVTAPAAGPSNGVYAAGSGVCVNWGTDGVWNGRRVRGRTFIVPIGEPGLATNGSLNDTRLTAWRTATATFVGAANLARLVVWKRPTVVLGEPLPDGGAYDVNSYTINDKVAQLRSRRD